MQKARGEGLSPRNQALVHAEREPTLPPCVFSLFHLTNVMSDGHRNKANSTWGGVLFPGLEFIKPFLQASENGPLLRAGTETEWAVGHVQFPCHQQ